MKFLSSILIALALGASPVAAGDFFSANSQMLIGDNISSTEYTWAKGSLSGYGFVDKSLNSDYVLTTHEARATVANPLYLSAEVGYNRFGGALGRIGVGVHLGSLSVVQDHFVFLNVYAQKSVFGTDASHLVGFSWQIKDIKVAKGVSLYGAGFADFKVDQPDVIQPQVWLKFDTSPIEVGTEVAIFGKQTSVSAAIKIKF